MLTFLASWRAYRIRRSRRFSPASARVLVAIVFLVGLGSGASFGQQPVVVRPASTSLQLETPAPPVEEMPPALPQPVLGLGELEQMAMAANPAIARASALVEAARGNWVQVGLLPNPSVGYDGQQLGSGGRAEQHGITFSQELVRGGKLQLNRLVAEQELFRAEQELAIQQQKVLTDVRVRYYEVLLAQRQIDLADTLVRISRQGAAAVENLFRGQEATRADVLQAQLEVENATILSQNSRNRHDAAWRSLQSVTGQPMLPPQALAGDAYAPPQPIDFQATLERLQTSSPEIASVMSEISRARFALDRARVDPIPNLSFQGLVNVIDNGVDGQPNAGVALSMPIPIFNRNQGAILEAQQKIVAAERALDQLELGLQQRLAVVFERYANSRNQVERYQAAILPAAQESLDLTRRTYEAGENSFLALLTAQRTFSQTNLNYLDALRELRIAEAEIQGLLLRDSLEIGR